MINYLLSLTLKEAGYPQEGMFCYRGDDREIIVSIGEPINKNCIIPTTTILGEKVVSSCIAPTLEELIEACGNRLTEMEQREVGDKWWAFYRTGGMTNRALQEQGSGPTLSEAVANLWLELNKKDD